MSEAITTTQTGSPVRLETKRAIVKLAAEEEAGAVVRYYSENREHLRPFDPIRPPQFYQEGFWAAQLRQNLELYSADMALRLFVFSKQEPGRVIGNIGFSTIVRGVAQHCTLGYSIGRDFEGKGLMVESLHPAIDFVFMSLKLHRIEANYMPHNRRSGNVLRRLGFAPEGYSRDFLQINGEWEDHIRTGLINPRWNELTPP
jgi:[ribosomal protein S5]-alanine N-acetyltransferase